MLDESMRNTTMIKIAIATIITAATAYTLRANIMPEIKFDIGNNIHETAKKSGAPRFSTRNVAGLISYKLIDLPPDIPAHYVRPGFEIIASPLFAFTLYADEEHNNGLAVQTARLRFSSATAKSHESAQAFVEGMIAQFEKGKWKRHIDELCPAVTGRSTFLNEAGEPGQIGGCPLDPQHRLSREDWIRLMRLTQDYEWIGDGVLATLTVGFSDDVSGTTYAITLEFDDLAIKNRRDQANLARTLTEGDKNGRNSTVKEKNNIAALKERIKTLEDNARKRGDTVIPR
jgi:hypothetical protein